jgi:hypothetical protein
VAQEAGAQGGRGGQEGLLTPTPPWAQCHVEVYEQPGWLDDCFRSGWAKVQSAESESFVNTGDISGDYATMTVTEGGTPGGCGYQKVLPSLGSSSYPLIRVRLRGRGTAPQYKVEVEYTDASTTGSGWTNAPTAFEAKTMELASSKTLKYVRLYARSNTGGGTAYIDYDYAAVIANPPLVPLELTECEVDLQTTSAVSGFRLRIHDDVLLGSTARRYSLDEGAGSRAYDLSTNKGHAAVVNATWNVGRFGGCLYLLASSSARLDTGYKPTIPADGAMTISTWVKTSPGASGVMVGSGRSVSGGFNRLQLNWSGDKVRVYAKDDALNVLQYTGTVTVADGAWHHIAAVVSPASDAVQLYVDGSLDGGATGTLGAISLDAYDLTLGCLHNEAGYGSYTTCHVDEAALYTRALTLKEIRGLCGSESLSGAARTPAGSIVMVYLAAECESLVYKLVKGRVIDRSTTGDPDEPTLELVGEDLGDVLHERGFTREYASETQISEIVEDIVDAACPELDRGVDPTNRGVRNRFRDEDAWGLLGRLAEAASFSTGESGANVFVDPGGCLRFKKYGAFSCPHALSDGSDGGAANILDLAVKESIKGSPRLVNDVKLVIFEEETQPRDGDSWTESAEGWSSPDPTDSGYPQSDEGDRVSGTASIHSNTTDCGTQYRLRLGFGEVDVAGYDQLKLWVKYGSGLSPQALEVRVQKGGWDWTADYRSMSGINLPPATTWGEITVSLAAMTVTGNPGSVVDNLELRFYAGSSMGTGGFLVDGLRFVRNEKGASASDSSSQAAYGRRSLVEVDKTITDTGYAGYVAGNILAHRKDPTVTVQARVPGRGQPGYRPPQTVQVTSLRHCLSGNTFQVQRARHRYTPGGGYTCDLDLVAARAPDGGYEPKVAPSSSGLGSMISELRSGQLREGLNSLRSEWV